MSQKSLLSLHYLKQDFIAVLISEFLCGEIYRFDVISH